MKNKSKKLTKKERCQRICVDDALKKNEQHSPYNNIPRLSAESIKKKREKESYYSSYDSGYNPNPEFYMNPETELDF
ncbi:MAG: hypothetical protein WC848_02625 [Parcubacteria group bacterium]|jgi:hypothetical protein